MKCDTKVILALDFPTIEPVRKLVAKLNPKLCRLKVGNILFTRYGPALVEELMQAGFDVFLDLKFHDIPQTVAGACVSAAELGVWMINLHISGGRAMINAAVNALKKCDKPPLLIGVTILTSLDDGDLALIGANKSVKQSVLDMAELAKATGLDGVVCSSQEAADLRCKLGPDFLLVTLGIRLEARKVLDDQKRIMTVDAALRAGASYLVIGRPITAADDPLAVLQSIVSES